MRFPLFVAIIVLLFNALVDVYIYMALVSYTRHKIWPRLQKWSSIFLFVALVAIICLPKRGGSDQAFSVLMWGLYGYISIYLCKYVFVIFDILSRLPMLWHRMRWRWMSIAGGLLGLCVFAALWWGALFNRYSLQVVNQKIEIANLPKAFDGFKILQISDLHVGTFGHDASFLEKLVSEINQQKADIVVFTGDLVNRQSDELAPFVDILSQIKSKYGVYSVLGNHDYGDYMSWPSEDAKAANLAMLKDQQYKMGWTMLNNETKWIKVGNDSIALIGVENIGDGPFKTYGDLSKAYANIGDENVKILLSHNPAHWEQSIAENPNSKVALTLSGHTHAMQVELFGWSPAAWRYKLWGGLYKDSKKQHLYVNIGAGEVGFPARIGATPEITVLTLSNE